ncbi:Histidine kinase-like ATPase, ATP-binding domain [Ostreococcus tauri]|uniref:Histidine kinase-like ATPase, ATP-binding domain n=1 Tax=Ostreococcus tauri TaxID=70448 RepID=A0A090M504_OSTTA|nr:Histidine kinase-like ATPase, ATP-binding domain [Ostreococcus tauri]CEF99276.1 Histidine kinase-like ATPase, ATP-binding domain [Ostreococcus tauri]|eukprot:XP_003081479.2 Histidine kinase-like ATPase, ATP-binding domain [Ostreococcus tauri]
MLRRALRRARTSVVAACARGSSARARATHAWASTPDEGSRRARAIIDAADGARARASGRGTVPTTRTTSWHRTRPRGTARTVASETIGFKAETRKLLDIVTNSLYAEREVFARELVSNASDALERARHDALARGEDPGRLEIRITTDDADGKTLAIEDDGRGMTREELVENLGTIAKSGSKAFLEGLDGTNEEAAANIIGKFGVGFYASFMVSDKVEVISSAGARGDGKAWKWSSMGDGTFTIEEATESDGAPARGTKILMHIKKDQKHLVSKWGMETVLKKYSSFVGFPILLNGNRMNDVGALWLKDEKDLTDEESIAFYRLMSGASDMPPFRMSFKADAPMTIRSLLYFPAENPERLAGIGGQSSSGVSLYARRVLIQQNTERLLPPFLRFVRGVIDCEDIPLNISRESLQDSMLVLRLGQIMAKRVLKFLDEKAKKEPEKYNKWFANLGFFLKEGVCSEYAYKQELAELLRYESSATEAGKLTSLRDYANRMPESQQNVYYIVAPSRQQAESSPYLEAAKSRGYEVLFLYAHIDEFVMQHLMKVAGKDLISVEAANLEVDEKSEDAEEALDESASADLCKWFGDDALGGKLKEVKMSTRLASSPAILSGHEPEAMRRYRMVQTMASDAAASKKLAEMANDFSMLTLELNPKHEMIRRVNAARSSSDADTRRLAALVAEQIFDNARVAAGSLDDPRAMLARLNEILEKTLPK